MPNIERLRDREYYTYDHCMELFFGAEFDSHEKLERYHLSFIEFLSRTDRLQRTTGLVPQYDSYNNIAGRFFQEEDFVNVQITQTGAISFRHDSRFSFAVRGGVYKIPKDCADEWIGCGIAIKTSIAPSSVEEIKAMLAEASRAEEDRWELNRLFGKDLMADEIPYLENNLPGVALLHRKPTQKGFLSWCRGNWIKISSLRHFPEDQKDVLADMVAVFQEGTSINEHLKIVHIKADAPPGFAEGVKENNGRVDCIVVSPNPTFQEASEPAEKEAGGTRKDHVDRRSQRQLLIDKFKTRLRRIVRMPGNRERKAPQIADSEAVTFAIDEIFGENGETPTPRSIENWIREIRRA